MTIIVPAEARTSVRPRRFAPKGNRPLVSQVVPLWQHAFVAQVIDPRSCVRCNLPAANGRHQ